MSDEYTLCPNCRDRYMPPGSSKCHACREQDMIDAEPWLDDPDFKGYGVTDDEDDPPGHVGFEMEVDGTTAHVLADPNMAEKTRTALAELIRHTIKWLDSKDAEDDT